MDDRPPTREELRQVILFSHALYAGELGVGVVFLLARAPVLGWISLFVIVGCTIKMHSGCRSMLEDIDEEHPPR